MPRILGSRMISELMNRSVRKYRHIETVYWICKGIRNVIDWQASLIIWIERKWRTKVYRISFKYSLKNCIHYRTRSLIKNRNIRKWMNSEIERHKRYLKWVCYRVSWMNGSRRTGWWFRNRKVWNKYIILWK